VGRAFPRAKLPWIPKDESTYIYSIAQDGFRLKGVCQPDRFLLILPLKSSCGQDDLINKMIENAFPKLMNERNGALGPGLLPYLNLRTERHIFLFIK
jgi:hypothetical protein